MPTPVTATYQRGLDVRSWREQTKKPAAIAWAGFSGSSSLCLCYTLYGNSRECSTSANPDLFGLFLQLYIPALQVMLACSAFLPYINTHGQRGAVHKQEKIMSNQPTIATVLADAKNAGFTVTKASNTVNGRTAYKVEGQNGVFTKTGLMQLIGVYG